MSRKRNNQVATFNPVDKIKESISELVKLLNKIYKEVVYFDSETNILNEKTTIKRIEHFSNNNYSAYIYSIRLNCLESSYTLYGEKYLTSSLFYSVFMVLFSKIKDESSCTILFTGRFADSFIILCNEDISEFIKEFSKEQKTDGVDGIRIKTSITQIDKDVDNFESVLCRLDYGHYKIKNSYTDDVCILKKVKKTL